LRGPCAGGPVDRCPSPEHAAAAAAPAIPKVGASRLGASHTAPGRGRATVVRRVRPVTHRDNLLNLPLP
jgi:hypothetical protein